MRITTGLIAACICANVYTCEARANTLQDLEAINREAEEFMYQMDIQDMQDDYELRQWGLDRNSQRIDQLEHQLRMLQQQLNRR
jgi:polyhydroxyalkanoate synthesis regulator phasin